MKRFVPALVALALTVSAMAQNQTQAPKPDEAATSDAPVPDGAPLPTVKTFPEAKAEYVDPRITPPPLPKKKISLIGATVREIDPIRNRLTVDVHGGKKPMKLIFDERTKVTRNGAEVNPLVIRRGDRVYLDTQLTRDKIFARQIQIITKMEAADLNGQVVRFDPKTREIELRDNLSARGFRFVIDHDAAITANGGKAATFADLQPGALVTAHFNSGPDGRGTIRDIAILAAPGAEFTLFGTVNHLDLRSGTLAVQNKADDKAYEVKFNPSQFQVDDLAMGSEVAVTARFDGQNYVAQSLNVTSTGQAARVDSDEADGNPGDSREEASKDKKKKDKERSGNEESDPK